MSIRDEEISRIRKYTEAIGVKLVMRNKSNKFAAAEWHLDGSQITIYIAKPENKTQTVLSLLHEIGHHMDWVHHKNREEDLKITEVYGRVDFGNKKHITTKSDRKVVYDLEKAGTEYWDMIVKDLDIKIPTWRIEQQKQFDLWQYEYYYENGYFPNRGLRREKMKELKEHCKNLY